MTTKTKGLRRKIKDLPVSATSLQVVIRNVRARRLRFVSSKQYWEDRYELGINSGSGSYGRLGHFKSTTLNTFVGDHDVRSVVEWGCGDGGQLTTATYPYYTGIDVSARAVELCRSKFTGDATKRFMLASGPEATEVRADLALSLDVIYHLVEDATFDEYMARLVRSADRYVAIYSSNTADAAPVPHVRHRVFTDWMAANAPGWELFKTVENPFPHDPDRPERTSWSDFFFYRRTADRPSE